MPICLVHKLQPVKSAGSTFIKKIFDIYYDAYYTYTQFYYGQE